MIASLQKIDTIALDAIDQAVLLRDAARPTSSKRILESFRLSDAGERIAQHRLDELKNSKRDIAICFNPMAQIFAKSRLKISLALGPARHDGLLEPCFAENGAG